MARVKHTPASHRRHRRVLKFVKGARGGRRRLIRTASETMKRALAYAYRDRRARRRDLRRLWITRITAAAELCGTSYSKLMDGLKKANIKLDRKSLADIAARDMRSFEALSEAAKAK